MQGEMQIGKPD